MALGVENHGSKRISVVMSLAESGKPGKAGWGRRKNGFCSGPVAFDILVEFKGKSSQNRKERPVIQN